MSTAKPLHLLAREYERYAREYCASLPPVHFMESTAQGRQREITLESLALVRARRPEVQVFNELLVQYPYGREKRPHQVVPDNMVVLWKESLQAEGSFDLPLQPVGPFWVLEYVSRHSERKDYEDNFRKYERELQVPYYLLFHPEKQELTLYRHTGRKYAAVRANSQGRHEISQLDLEIALLNGWVRYWYQGELLPLPEELLRQRDEEQQGAARLQQDLEAAERELRLLRARLEKRRRRPREGP
jgi:Uma2 family endonuclease